MRYKALLTIRVEHGSYSTARCEDLALAPDAESQRTLDRLRMVCKRTADGVTVAAPVDGAGEPLVPYPAALSLDFVAQVRRHDFVLFTDLPQWCRSDMLEFGNVPGAGGGVLVPREASARDRPGELARIQIEGIEPAWLAADPARFVLQFAPRSAHWAFYGVTRRKNGAALPWIEHTAAVGEDVLEFLCENLAVPGGPGPEDDLVAASLAARYPEHERYRLVSERPVPCRHTPVTGLALHVGVDSEPVLSDLPNPLFRNYSRIRFEVGGISTRLQTLYRIVTY